ncbi:MAG: hypothetical protein HRU11_06735, partial [Parvularculaceae bacterium]|nr:hypothetical protein [Parvularculaceae bacterium]
WNCNGTGGNKDLQGVGGIDCLFSLQLSIPEFLMAEIADDGVAVIEILMSDAVNSFDELDQQIVTFEYTAGSAAVPVPAAALLFAPIAAGAAWRRRKQA